MGYRQGDPRFITSFVGLGRHVGDWGRIRLNNAKTTLMTPIAELKPQPSERRRHLAPVLRDDQVVTKSVCP